jgi:hypothetical protein
MIKHPECTGMGHEDCDMCSGCDRLWQRDRLAREPYFVVYAMRDSHRWGPLFFDEAQAKAYRASKTDAVYVLERHNPDGTCVAEWEEP